MAELVLAAFVGAELFFLGMMALRRRGEAPTAPTRASVAPPGESPLLDPLATRIYLAQQRVNNEAPHISTPDELLGVRPFLDLVTVLSEPEATTDLLLRYFQGEDAVLCWASLVALSRRSADPVAANVLLARLNRFHHWTRFFLLRTLET
jgi:hypothetical protein